MSEPCRDSPYQDGSAPTIPCGHGSPLAGVLASLLVPPAHAQTDDSALAPSNLTAELVDGHVSLDWDAPSEVSGSITGYEVLRCPLNGKDALGILVADSGNADTTFQSPRPKRTIPRAATARTEFTPGGTATAS